MSELFETFFVEQFLKIIENGYFELFEYPIEYFSSWVSILKIEKNVQ